MGTNVSGEVDGRELGWLQALRDAGVPEGPIITANSPGPAATLRGEWLLASVNRPTAIFASSDMQGIGLLRAFHEAGVAVPGGMAIASFDGSVEAEYSWPPLTTVEQPCSGTC